MRYWRIIAPNGAEGLTRYAPEEWGNTSDLRALRSLVKKHGGRIDGTVEMGDEDVGWREEEPHPVYESGAFWDRNPYPRCPVSGKRHYAYYTWCFDCRGLAFPGLREGR